MEQRDELRRQLVGADQSAASARGAERAAPPVPTSEQIQRATALDTRIQDSQRQLDELLLKFTDQHPDVIALRATIASLEERRRTEFGFVRPTTAVAVVPGSPRVDTILQDIQIQLNAKNVQIAALQEQVSQTEQRVANMRTMLGSGPQIEAELASLNRDYGVTKMEYEQLLQRLESARISGRANASEGVAYRVLEPPRLPLTPVAPKRGLLMAAVLFVALLAGTAVSWFLSQLKPSFMDMRMLRGAFELPVVGAVTFAPTRAQISERRHRAISYAVGVAALGGAATAAIVLAAPSAVFLHAILGSSGQ
jgi:polysaccharide chain length determinant protein (PEP-CTERM system associated)